MRVLKIQKITASVLVASLGLFLWFGGATAGGKGAQKIRIRLISNDLSSGRILVTSKPFRPDIFLLRAKGLDSKTRYTVFLTHSKTPDALPAQLLGEFTTNAEGRGKLLVRTEVVNAFASANQDWEDADGIADIIEAGGLSDGAVTIPLNWVRVYAAEGGLNVFGGSEAEFGGALVLTSTKALP